MTRVIGSFDDFVIGNGESLLRTAHLITLDRGEAEDLVQECLLKLSRRWNDVSAMDQPAAYARRVLVNLAVRGSRRRSRQRVELDTKPAERGVSSAAFELVGIREELLTGLLRLTPRQRTMLVLRYFQDLSETQVAESLGCSIGTVRSTTARSLMQLRDVIGSASTSTGSDH
jgi:RNA polymerase sigma-70 factor (sigma-E family)